MHDERRQQPAETDQDYLLRLFGPDPFDHEAEKAKIRARSLGELLMELDTAIDEVCVYGDLTYPNRPPDAPRYIAASDFAEHLLVGSNRELSLIDHLVAKVVIPRREDYANWLRTEGYEEKQQAYSGHDYPKSFYTWFPTPLVANRLTAMRRQHGWVEKTIEPSYGWQITLDGYVYLDGQDELNEDEQLAFEV